MKRRAIFILAAAVMCFSAGAQAARDTVYMNYPQERTMAVPLNHDYTKTLVTKLFLSQALYDGRYKHADNGRQEVCMNFEQALGRIRALDNITLGMPKIAYLVGWQYNGHDSGYPAFFDGNSLLKRDCDADANESIAWLAEEAQKYNTAVSFHINMFDGYEDSPLFGKYLKADVFARLKTGHLRPSEWGYKISYAQEWNSGLARERIDEICRRLPVQKAGTIHIDAFHSVVPYPIEKADGSYSVVFDSVISPYHGWSREQETAAQIEIIKYWASKGVDVTTEGLGLIAVGGKNPFAGYCPMVWHISADWHLRFPESMLTGGDCGGYIEKKVFGSNESLEGLLRQNPCDYSGVIRLVCTSTFISNYINRFERRYYVRGKDYGKVVFDGGLETEVDGDRFTVRKDGILLTENDDIFIPALWMDGMNIVAYSADGYRGRTWDLLPSYPSKGGVTVWEVDQDGKRQIGRRRYSGGRIRLDVKPGQMLLLSLD